MTRARGRERIPRNVIALGLVSFLTDVSSEMIVPLLPLFLPMLGGGALALGWVEGSADAVASVLKLAGGRWADRMGRYRPLVIAGYGLSALARPLMALARVPWHAVLVRSLDRTGKGLRTSPRDALIAASTRDEHRGAAYGFHRAMDHAGAVLGPLLAVGLYAYATQDLRTIFWLAAIPGALGVVVIFTRVREQNPPMPAGIPWSASMPDRRLMALLMPLAIFTLGNASDVFLLLKAADEKSGPVELALLWSAFHVVKAAASFWGGRWTDRFGSIRLIAAGWVVYAAVYASFAVVHDRTLFAAILLVYGCYHGLTEGAEKTLVANLAPRGLRGVYFGWYYLVVGLLALPASVLFGAVWSTLGSATAFGMGAALACAATAALLVLRPGRT